MRVTMRLYKMHDLDLIALYQDPNINFKKLVLSCVEATANGTPFWTEPSEYQVDLKNTARIIQIGMTIPDDEIEVMQIINSIQDGFRNGYLKNLVRSYVLSPTLAVYYTKNEYKTSNEMTRKIRTFPQSLRKYKKKETNDIDTLLKEKNKSKIEEVENIDVQIETKKIDVSEEAPVPIMEPTQSKVSEPETTPNISDTSDKDDDFDLFSSFMDLTN